jgi:hypothetical protein
VGLLMSSMSGFCRKDNSKVVSVSDEFIIIVGCPRKDIDGDAGTSSGRHRFGGLVAASF